MWTPQNVARIRAELAHGYRRRIDDETQQIGRIRARVDQLSTIIDDGVLLDLRPEFHDELVEDLEEYQEDLPRLADARAHACIAADVVAEFTPTWLLPSSVTAVRSVAVESRDTTHLTGLTYAGCILFGEPIAQIGAYLDPFRLEWKEVDVDGVLWWSYADDRDEDERGTREDSEPSPSLAVILHILTRSRTTTEPHWFRNPWDASSLADVSSCVIPVRVDADLPASDDIVPVVNFLQRLGAAVKSDTVRVSEHALPPSKREYVRPGWPELAPLTSLSVVSAA